MLVLPQLVGFMKSVLALPRYHPLVVNAGLKLGNFDVLVFKAPFVIEVDKICLVAKLLYNLFSPSVTLLVKSDPLCSYSIKTSEILIEDLYDIYALFCPYVLLRFV